MYQSCLRLSTSDQKRNIGLSVARSSYDMPSLSMRARSGLRSSFVQLDADERGAVLAVVLLGVFEERDVVGGAEGFVEVALEGSRTPREIDHEVVLEPLIDEAAFDNFGVAADVVVAARKNADDRLAF